MSISQLTAHERLRATTAAAARRTQAATSTSAANSAVRQADSVTISPEARKLSAARQASGTNELRENRIAALKAAVANGTYAVSARDLATSMMKAAEFGRSA